VFGRMGGAEHDAKHPKCAIGGMFWVFGMMDKVRKTLNTKNMPPKACFSCSHERWGGEGAEHRKHAHIGMFWMFGMRGVVGELLNMCWV